ncbi:MAG: lysophospholipid acyltransferase family protein [bacterium]|nr:lysophospholipid acyltransferase family protein [bacterium]
MTAVLFWLFVYPISRLSLKILYWISSPLFFLSYYIFGYRRAVVKKQLRDSFPSKSSEELNKIEKKFYREFSDTLIESLKLFTISKKEVLQRVVIQNPKVLDNFYREGRSVIALMGHYCNWEMMCVGMPPQFKHDGAVIYSTLKNSYVNRAVNKYREKLGMIMFSKKQIKSWVKTCQEKPVITFFVSDQFPKKAKKTHITTFLNQRTEVALGAERYAITNNWPVVYLKSHKPERGVIHIEFVVISENPENNSSGEITEKYSRMLENQINEHPEYWLWTHKRWKQRG